jgi:hypothetical protein
LPSRAVASRSARVSCAPAAPVASTTRSLKKSSHDWSRTKSVQAKNTRGVSDDGLPAG